MSKPAWTYTTRKNGRVGRARRSRSEIVVRVEREGNEKEYAERGYPLVFGLEAATAQALLEVRDEEILP